MMSVSRRQMGPRFGESFSCPQPWLNSLSATPMIAGIAIMNTRSCIMLALSTCTLAPISRCSTSGIEKGASTVETRIAARPSEALP